MKEKEVTEKSKKEYKYIRTGRCNPKACGVFCCRTGPIMTKYNRKGKRAKDDIKYYEMQNMRPIGNLDGCVVLSSRVACAALRGLRCGIHKNRPSICKEFPMSKDQDFYKIAVKHGCTYRFKKVRIKTRSDKKCKKDQKT